MTVPSGPSRFEGESRRAPPAVDALVLAAGRGVRLGALTQSVPKVLLTVRGRPLLDYHLEALRKAGVRRVGLVVHHLAEQVERHVRTGEGFGLEVTSVRQAEPRGTGDAVRSASSWIRSDPFLVCYADVFVPTEPELLRDFLTDPTPKIAAARVADGGNFGRLRTRPDAEGLSLVDIEEKDGRPGPALVNAGLYLLPRSVLDHVGRLAPSERGEYELTDAVRSFVASGGTVRVVPIDDWIDAGTVESLARANELRVPGPG